MSEKGLYTINVVFITDTDYALPTGVAIESLFQNRNSKRKYQVFVLCKEVSPEIQLKLTKRNTENFQIILRNAKETAVVENVVKRTHVPETALYKFLLPKIFSELDKVLYLDGDTLILDDLQELYDTDIEEHYLAAVPEMLMVKRTQQDYVPRKIDNPRMYFNSGVMLLNLQSMREDETWKQLVDYKKTDTNPFMDQDALNVIIGKKLKNLHPRYNDMREIHLKYSRIEIANFYEISIEDVQPNCYEGKKILHWAGPYKPWKDQIFYHTDIFFSYLSSSSFSIENSTISPKYFVIDSLEEQLSYGQNLWQMFQNFWIEPSSLELLFFGGGKQANLVLSWFREKNLPLPLAICDNNSDIQGKHLQGVPIISFEEALKKYPKAFFLITAYAGLKEIYPQITEKVNPSKVMFFDFGIISGLYYDFNESIIQRLKEYQGLAELKES